MLHYSLYLSIKSSSKKREQKNQAKENRRYSKAIKKNNSVNYFFSLQVDYLTLTFPKH